jgi:hypothetical protein
MQVVTIFHSSWVHDVGSIIFTEQSFVYRPLWRTLSLRMSHRARLLHNYNTSLEIRFITVRDFGIPLRCK